MLDKFVASMATLRFSPAVSRLWRPSSSRLNQVDKALAVNSALAFMGPLILILTTTIGLVGMADKLSWGRSAGFCAAFPVSYTAF